LKWESEQEEELTLDLGHLRWSDLCSTIDEQYLLLNLGWGLAFLLLFIFDIPNWWANSLAATDFDLVIENDWEEDSSHSFISESLWLHKSPDGFSGLLRVPALSSFDLLCLMLVVLDFSLELVLRKLTLLWLKGLFSGEISRFQRSRDFASDSFPLIFLPSIPGVGLAFSLVFNFQIVLERVWGVFHNLEFVFNKLLVLCLLMWSTSESTSLLSTESLREIYLLLSPFNTGLLVLFWEFIFFNVAVLAFALVIIEKHPFDWLHFLILRLDLFDSTGDFTLEWLIDAYLLGNTRCWLGVLVEHLVCRCLLASSISLDGSLVDFNVSSSSHSAIFIRLIFSEATLNFLAFCSRISLFFFSIFGTKSSLLF